MDVDGLTVAGNSKTLPSLSEPSGLVSGQTYVGSAMIRSSLDPFKSLVSVLTFRLGFSQR